MSRLDDALRRCDQLVGAETLEYFCQLYDPASGGFYYSISSRDSVGTTPFAEGTRFVLESLRAGGIELPEWYKNKVGEWIRSHQDEDGWFYEELWGKNTSGPRKNRDLTFSISILRDFCGIEPLYTIPQERMKTGSYKASASIPEYLENPAKLTAYLDSLDWSTRSIWGTGQKLATAVSLIEAAGMYDLVYEYAKARQNPETGLWGEGLGWMNTNGAMKLSSYFCDDRHPFPRIEKMFESVFAIFEGNDPAEHATYIWNPFVLIKNALCSVGDRSGEMRACLMDSGADIVNLALDSALRLKRCDGGFSSDIDRAQSFQQGWRYGLGLADESDMDGTVIAGQRLRNTIYDVFGVPCSHDYYREYESEFWEWLRNKPPVRKTLPYIDCRK